MTFRRERDPSLIGTVKQVDSVRDRVDLLARQFHARVVEYERVVTEQVAQAPQVDPEGS